MISHSYARNLRENYLSLEVLDFFHIGRNVNFSFLNQKYADGTLAPSLIF